MVWSVTSRERAGTRESGPRSGVLAAAEIDARSPRAQVTPGRAAGIDLNTATAAQLELLPGVGPTLAARIVQDRQANGPFKSVDDLDRVKGIGPGIVEKVRLLARASSE